jgi:hypothetical protein
MVVVWHCAADRSQNQGTLEESPLKDWSLAAGVDRWGYNHHHCMDGVETSPLSPF